MVLKPFIIFVILTSRDITRKLEVSALYYTHKLELIFGPKRDEVTGG
jgi:hypothetical protein